MRRVTAATLLATAIAGFAMTAPQAAWAAPSQRTDVRSDRRATAESIAAQYAAEQFRTAQIGDERTRKLLAENDTNRRRLAAVLKDAKATAADRDKAKAELAVLDVQLKEVNAKLLNSQQAGDELRAQVREYARQITEAVDTASPEVAAAYELYAQGDRDTAFEVIDRLSQAEAAAAKRAGEIRAGALLRRPAVLAMDRRERGEMSITQVIAVWERAQVADPSWWRGWVDLTNLRIEAGELPAAKTSAEQASATASTDDQKAVGAGLQGEVLIAMGDSNAGRKKLDEALEIAKRATAAFGNAPMDDAQADAWRTLIGIYDREGDLLMSENSFNEAAGVYGEELKICRSMIAARPDNIGSQRDLEVCLAKAGDAFVAQRDLAKAKATFEELLALSRKVLATNPTNLAYQRETAAAALKMADFHQEFGDRANGRALAAEGLEIARRLFAADSANPTARRDLTAALLISAEGLEPTPATLAQFRKLMDETVALRIENVAAQPASAAALRDLAYAHQAMAAGLSARNDLPGTKVALDAEVAAFRRVAALNTSTGYDQRRVGLALTDVARVVQAQSGDAAAKPYWDDALAIHRKLAEQNPDSSLVNGDLGGLLATMADVRYDARDWAGAKTLYEEALTITTKAHNADKANRYIFRTAGVVYLQLGEVAYELRDAPGVSNNYERAVNIFEQLHTSAPDDAAAAFDLGRAVFKWGEISEDRRFFVDAVRYFELADAKSPLNAYERPYLEAARRRAKAPPVATPATPAPPPATPSAAPSTQGHD